MATSFNSKEESRNTTESTTPIDRCFLEKASALRVYRAFVGVHGDRCLSTATASPVTAIHAPGFQGAPGVYFNVSSHRFTPSSSLHHEGRPSINNNPVMDHTRLFLTEELVLELEIEKILWTRRWFDMGKYTLCTTTSKFLGGWTNRIRLTSTGILELKISRPGCKEQTALKVKGKLEQTKPFILIKEKIPKTQNTREKCWERSKKFRSLTHQSVFRPIEPNQFRDLLALRRTLLWILIIHRQDETLSKVLTELISTLPAPDTWMNEGSCRAHGSLGKIPRSLLAPPPGRKSLWDTP